MKQKIQGILFDLDGTLLDTAPDMYAALATLMLEQGRTPLAFGAVRNKVSHGSQALVQLGFPDVDERTHETLRQRFLELYARKLCVATELFPGISSVLDRCTAQDWKIGVVTNKPAWLTDPLLDALGLSSRLDAIVSGDTLPQRKPAPEPMWLAAEQTGLSPEQHCYWGDAERDIAAGRAAGMSTLIAAWGYIDADQTPARWKADATLEHPETFWDWHADRTNPQWPAN